MLGWVQNALVVIVDNLFSVIHATVAYLLGIAVEEFSKLVVFRKVFVNHGEESVFDISADVFAKWRVVPEDVPMSVSPFGSHGWLVV